MPSERVSPWEEVRAFARQPFVVLDTETTGLVDPEMVSVAVVSRSGQPLVHRLVKPGKPIEPDASRITGLDAAAVADALSFPAIEPELTAALSGRRVAIYNADYDAAVLRNAYARHRVPLPRYEPWCVMTWFARLFGEWDARHGDFVWKPLAVAADYFGVRKENPHNALEDALTTWRILDAAIAVAERGNAG
jgi:DNA polymerase III epsilon subunit-like protein